MKGGQNRTHRERDSWRKDLLEVRQLALWPFGKQHTRKREQPAQRPKEEAHLDFRRTTRRPGSVGLAGRECLGE